LRQAGNNTAIDNNPAAEANRVERYRPDAPRMVGYLSANRSAGDRELTASTSILMSSETLRLEISSPGLGPCAPVSGAARDTGLQD
jgi:hypothetical protein